MTHPNKGKRFPPEVLTPREVMRIMDACADDFWGIRTRAMIAVMYRAGLRHSEVLDLEPKDLDRKAGSVRVLHGKGDKSRTVGMDKEGFKEVKRWVRVRDPEAIKLFHSATGARLASSYLRQILPGLGKKAGIKKRCMVNMLLDLGACRSTVGWFERSALSAREYWGDGQPPGHHFISGGPAAPEGHERLTYEEAVDALVAEWLVFTQCPDYYREAMAAPNSEEVSDG